MTISPSPTNVLDHIAIIMDGNGRWAEHRGLSRSQGHRQGVETAREIVRAVMERHINTLTLYAFSSENWSRPKAEVNFLMELISRYIKSDLEELHSNGVKVCIVGSRESLQPNLIKLIDHAETLTRDNDRLNLQIAFNYGGREEILSATKNIAARVASGEMLVEDITEDIFASALQFSTVSDPDLVIRTSGELRISNFLLWQSAYSEFHFTQTLWPDFTGDDLDIAIEDYAKRERRFGDIASHKEHA